MAPKGVSNRTLLAKRKGIKVGQTIVVSYREEGKGAAARYEGVLADRRIGGTDRESYIEMRPCRHLGPGGEVAAVEASKRLVDAFIDDMDVTEARPEPPPPEPGAGAGAAGPAAPAGMLPVGMGMMPMPMGMGPMGMGPMGPLMGPMGMGSMLGPMGALMPGMAAMQMAAMAGPRAGGAKSSSAPAAGAGADAIQLGREPDCSPEDIAVTLEGIEEGQRVRVAYTHPRLGKTRYQGVLSEKYAGASNLQSYIQLSDCQRLGSRGHVREQEATKRLMLAFIDGVSVAGPARGEARSRSRSPARP